MRQIGRFAQGGRSGRRHLEIANLSRNVVVESADLEVRGHTMYHRNSAGSLSYTCTSAPGVTFSASINGALNPRQMVRLLGGGDVLRYDIYVDVARTQVWSSTVQVVLPAGIQTIPYYGRADAQQDIQTGTYGDVITITLNF